MEKKIRIVFLCRNFGIVNRGVESYVNELANRLVEKFDVSIFAGEDADNISKVIKEKFNLVIPTNGRMQTLKVSFGRLFGGYRTLIAGHAGIGRDEVINLLTFPDVYVPLTQAEYKWAHKYAWNTKMVKISNGIDLNKFKPNGKKINFELEPPIILSVGALEWYKHHDLAILAVAALGKASLLIVGTGPGKNKLLNLGAQLLGKNRFKIIEADYEEMPKIYRSGDLFTLPSWDREAFGIVYLEAMATGLAIVAPEDSSRKEIIGEAGILTDVFNTTKYAKALEEALKKKWKNIPRRQAEKFSWEVITKKYAELILQVCR